MIRRWWVRYKTWGTLIRQWVNGTLIVSGAAVFAAFFLGELWLTVAAVSLFFNYHH
jgi:hypothetical protein